MMLTDYAGEVCKGGMLNMRVLHDRTALHRTEVAIDPHNDRTNMRKFRGKFNVAAGSGRREGTAGKISSPWRAA